MNFKTYEISYFFYPLYVRLYRVLSDCIWHLACGVIYMYSLILFFLKEETLKKYIGEIQMKWAIIGIWVMETF